MEIRKGIVNKDFWKNKKVYLTGHTGFKGSWLSLWLVSMGAKVKGYSLPANTKPSLFEQLNLENDMLSEIGDIRNLKNLSFSMKEFNPDILIHMAAQPLVRLSYEFPVDTYSTNVMGTVNVLEAARYCSNLKSIVTITTDKCYENKEWEWGYRENEAMGGYDPYSSSKGSAELVISAYRRSFFYSNSSPSLASGRAGNVIGGGDWSEDRLVPDILKAFTNSKPVLIRNPLSTRPWQHVLEPLSGYMVLAQQLYLKGDKYAEGWNFGPNDEDCKSVSWILDEMVKNWGKNASWSLDKSNNPHEAGFLKLDCSKAHKRLKWKPKLNLKNALKSIVEWYKIFDSGGNIKKKYLKEINEYKL